MAKILLVTLVFSPDGVSTSVLMTELALGLKEAGHDVVVLTATPHYNKDSEADLAQPLRSRWGRMLFESNCKGIPVLHASVPKKADKLGARLFGYLQFHLVSTMAGLILLKGYEVVFAPSPPLTIGISAWILGLSRRVPFIYNVQEIYPDIAVQLGVLRNRSVIRLMERLEKFIYDRSKKVVVISEWFRKHLMNKGLKENKIAVIPNFVDIEFIKPMDRRNRFSKTHAFDNKFIVLYAGNIGLTQDFENILDAAGRLENLPDLCILIVGDGSRRSWLEEQLKKNNPPNVNLLPYQPKSIVPEMYASSDICLVPLKKGTAHGTFPSKIYTIMAAGRPAIVVADRDSELDWVARKSGCGWVVPPGEAGSLASAINDAYHQKSELQRRGRLGREYVERSHAKRIVVERYDQLISQIVNKKQSI